MIASSSETIIVRNDMTMTPIRVGRQQPAYPLGRGRHDGERVGARTERLPADDPFLQVEAHGFVVALSRPGVRPQAAGVVADEGGGKAVVVANGPQHLTVGTKGGQGL
jgi:hypothetical protein